MRWLPLILALALAPGFVLSAEPSKTNGRTTAVVKKKAVKKPQQVKRVKKARKPLRSPKRPEKKPAPSANLSERWQDLQQLAAPRILIAACEKFETDFPASEYGAAVHDMLTGARQALLAQRTAQLSADAFVESSGDAAYRAELVLAARGDAEAAHRVALMYGEGVNGLPRSIRRHEQWLRIAAELGHGSASWQLAESLNRSGQWAEAAKYESRAVELGYRPPPRLSSKARDF